MAPGSAEKGPGISRAVGRPTIDAPVGGRRVPEIKAPEKSHLVRNLAVAVGATALTAAGVGYAINTGHGSSPQPTENPGGIVEPSITPIPTPFPTENSTVTLPIKTPSPTPEATPTPTTEPTLKPTENLTALEKTLNSWVDGSYKMPELFKQSWDGKDAPLYITFWDLKQFESMDLNTNSIGYQGILLGQQITDNHLIIYVGQKDSKGNNYYFPINVRKLDTGIPVTISQAGDFIDSDTSKNFIFANLVKTQENIQKNVGKAINFELLLSIPPEVKNKYDFSDINPSLQYTINFTKYNMYIGMGNAYNNALGASKFSSLINHKITKIDSSKIPSLGVLSVRNLIK